MPDDGPSRTEISQGRDAYDRLIAEIRTGALTPGARLVEADLAARLGISRTPIREAIRALESDGLVEHLPRAGARLRQLDPAEITELYEMRAVLEGTAARLAARAAYDSEIAELAAITAEMAAELGQPNRMFRCNQAFHDLLIAAARNRFLSRAAAAVHKTLLILGPSTLEDTARAEAAIAEHRAVLAAIDARDGAAAEAAMRIHIEAAHLARLAQLRVSAP